MSNRTLAESEILLRLWGRDNLSPQQKRIWRLLVARQECCIDKLFVAARPYSERRKIPNRVKHAAVGMVTSRINKKLKEYQPPYIIRPGDSRFSYRLEPCTR